MIGRSGSRAFMASAARNSNPPQSETGAGPSNSTGPYRLGRDAGPRSRPRLPDRLPAPCPGGPIGGGEGDMNARRRLAPSPASAPTPRNARRNLIVTGIPNSPCLRAPVANAVAGPPTGVGALNPGRLRPGLPGADRSAAANGTEVKALFLYPLGGLLSPVMWGVAAPLSWRGARVNTLGWCNGAGHPRETGETFGIGFSCTPGRAEGAVPRWLPSRPNPECARRESLLVSTLSSSAPPLARNRRQEHPVADPRGGGFSAAGGPIILGHPVFAHPPPIMPRRAGRRCCFGQPALAAGGCDDSSGISFFFSVAILCLVPRNKYEDRLSGQPGARGLCRAPGGLLSG